ncbi:TetR/AcrR family transcriptional regulator [Salininema proteolyticum]|uniref:TetR/AcrR family transcriptional regulator n=1 Tax=Salininema proteolyticum TaxID=1607685 RepID=A0ABV8TWF4_9ACTN
MAHDSDTARPVRHGSRGRARRDEILSVALGVIAENGYRGLTLGEVAKRVGLSQQGVLHYFPSKEELLIGVLRQRDEWDVSAPFGGENAVEFTVGDLEMLVEVNAARPEIVRTFSALLGESITEEHPAGPYFKDRYDWVRDSIESTLRGEFGETMPSGITAAQGAIMLTALMDGLQYQWLHDPEKIDMPELFHGLTRLVTGRES